MKIFGYSIVKDDKLHAGDPVIANNIQYLSAQGFSYMGNSLSSCGPLRISRETFYEILKTNTEAQAGKNLVVDMVGKGGIKLINEKTEKEIENYQLEKEIKAFFTDSETNSFKGHRNKFFNNHFASGQIYGYKSVDGTGKPRDCIITSKRVTKNMDAFLNIKSYMINNATYTPENFYEQITQSDFDNPGYGMSAFQTIVYNALADHEAGKRNFYFFKNNAAPSLFIIPKDKVANPLELQNAVQQFKDKFSSSEKSHGVLANNDIKDIKVIDLKNSDLQLLELSIFSIQRMGVVYRLNPKLFGWSGDKFGSYGEFEQIAIQGDDVINTYGEYYEEYLNGCWRKFVDPNANYLIKMVNDSFLDKRFKLTTVKDLVDRGIMTRKEGRIMMGMRIENLGPGMDLFTVNKTYLDVETIEERSKPEQKTNNTKDNDENDEVDNKDDE